MTQHGLYRWTARLTATIMLAFAATTAHAQQAHRFMLDAGIGQIEWLAPGSWGTTVAAQSRLVSHNRLAIIAGLRGTFNLLAKGNGLTRRDNVATGLVGLEVAALDRKTSALFVSASGAWSRYTAHYSGPSAPFIGDTSVSGYTWPSAIFGLRAELLRDRRVGISVRSDVRPRSRSVRTLNPTFGVGLTF